MIRLRDSRGNVIETPVKPAVVEICSTDGKVARLIVVSGPRILTLTPKDPEMQQYCEQVGAEMAEEVTFTSNKSTH